MNADSGSDPHWSHSALPKIVNILAYIFFTGTHAYFVWNGTYADGASKLTYITPAPWVLLIWPVIHLLLLGTIIYQFTENGRRIVVEGISWRFLVVLEVTALYLYLWHIHEYVLAFLVAIVNSFLVSDIYEILDEIQLQYTTPIPASIFVYIPFSLYYAWTSVLIFLSGFAAFGVDAATQPAGTYTKICVFLTLFYLQSSTAGGLYGWLTTVWYLWGVFVYQRSSGFVHESALVFAVLASVWVGEALIDGIVSYLWRGERGGVGDEESAPLLG